MALWDTKSYQISLQLLIKVQLICYVYLQQASLPKSSSEFCISSEFQLKHALYVFIEFGCNNILLLDWTELKDCIMQFYYTRIPGRIYLGFNCRLSLYPQDTPWKWSCRQELFCHVNIMFIFYQTNLLTCFREFQFLWIIQGPHAWPDFRN